ncbi:MAG: response regulator transcription factor [Actinomycetota bacterium]|nr:response regulator transcription factor [Actinomycetota bacterium]
MNEIRVLIVGDSLGLTQDLLLALRRRSGVKVLAPVADGASAIRALAETPVDLVVVDLDRSDEQGVAVVGALRDASDTRVMAATRHVASPFVELALAAGACGVLPTEREPGLLVTAFRRALAGELVLPVAELPNVVDRLWQARALRTEYALLGSLTSREREILAALAEGATTTELADELGISPATVQTHVKNVLAKLGVHSKVEAVGAAWRTGLTLTSRSA